MRFIHIVSVETPPYVRDLLSIFEGKKMQVVPPTTKRASSWESFIHILNGNDYNDIILCIRFAKHRFTLETLPAIVRRVDKRR